MNKEEAEKLIGKVIKISLNPTGMIAEGNVMEGKIISVLDDGISVELIRDTTLKLKEEKSINLKEGNTQLLRFEQIGEYQVSN